jgi:alkylation response protein AidB-like acyl-CoA dehydrogenase
MADRERFRSEVRSWLEENAPHPLRGTAVSPFQGHWGGRLSAFADDATRQWFERCLERGWTAPDWPTEYGGGGLSVAEHRILLEELARIRMPLPLVGFGLTMLGPTLLVAGSEQQKRAHLPPIVRGEIRWCQGYSEPDAGSDLASLRCRAVLDGDELVIDGQKVWTSHADKSDWIFCLVRTDPDVRKQEGISFVLMDMRTPGIEVRPIELISGASPFCETFFRGVRTPVGNVVGELNRGWTVAKALLRYERAMVGEAVAGGGSRPPILTHFRLSEAAKELGANGEGRVSDPHLRSRIAGVEMEAAAVGYTVRRGYDAMRAGRRPGAESSVAKIAGTELNQRRWELATEILGEDGLGWDGPDYDDIQRAVARQWLRSRGNTIEGGTTEVQLNILAKRVLGLPKGA